MGRWSDGEMGRWGDGVMGRWGDGVVEQKEVEVIEGVGSCGAISNIH